MKNSFGNNVIITVFGESHGGAVGAVLDGMTPGIPVNTGFIASQLSKRRQAGELSTARCETDEFVIQSGVFNGFTTGAPICIVIPNRDVHSKDYSEIECKARPGHADYTAFCKYGKFRDFRGGGHTGGRITAGIVACGAIAIDALKQKGILIGTHMSRCAGINDRKFENIESDIKLLNSSDFAVLDKDAAQKMKAAILEAKSDGDSVGGVLETTVSGLFAGVGEPWFDSLEGVLSHALFSIPAVKGIEFGDGFAICDMRGSAANDPMHIENGRVITDTNRNGGINGGISNGMPLTFRCAVKPTPTVFKEQNTVDFNTLTDTVISPSGRHDPCIVHRACVVADSITALVLCDMLSGKFGTDYLGAK